MMHSKNKPNRTPLLRAVLTTLTFSFATPFAGAQEASLTRGGTVSTEEQISSVSTFTIPTSLSEGRDPFYPRSVRCIATPVDQKKATGPVVLEFKGISGTPDRPLAIINNRTFAVGEEQEVRTSEGRVKLQCLEIDTKAMKVRVLAQGQTRELLLRKGI